MTSFAVCSHCSFIANEREFQLIDNNLKTDLTCKLCGANAHRISMKRANQLIIQQARMHHQQRKPL